MVIFDTVHLEYTIDSYSHFLGAVNFPNKSPLQSSTNPYSLPFLCAFSVLRTSEILLPRTTQSRPFIFKTDGWMVTSDISENKKEK
jgi:hypothetical protein